MSWIDLSSYESSENLGASYWVPNWVVILVRILGSLGHLGLGVVVLVLGKTFPRRLRSYVWLYTLPGIAHLLMGLSFMLLTAISVKHSKGKESATLNKVILPLYHTAISVATLLPIGSTLYAYYSERRRTPAIVSRFIINPMLWTAYSLAAPIATIDFALGSRVRFHYLYIPLPLIVLIAWTVITRYRDGFRFPHAVKFLSKSKDKLLLLRLCFHIACLFIASVAVPLSHLNGWIYKWRKSKVSSKTDQSDNINREKESKGSEKQASV